jgi:hypothetical protein
MIYLCIVMEVIQKRIPQRTIVMIPGTHPRTLRATLLSALLKTGIWRKWLLTRETTTVP